MSSWAVRRFLRWFEPVFLLFRIAPQFGYSQFVSNVVRCSAGARKAAVSTNPGSSTLFAMMRRPIDVKPGLLGLTIPTSL